MICFNVNLMIVLIQYDFSVSSPWHYDCGVELDQNGYYGRDDYDERIPLHSQYLLLLANFSAFTIHLYTQESAEDMLSGPVITDTLPVRQYCFGQLLTIWSHIQTNIGISTEEASHLMMRTMINFLLVCNNQSSTVVSLYCKGYRVYDNLICAFSFKKIM